MMLTRRLFVVAVTGLIVGCGAHHPPTVSPNRSVALPVTPVTGLPNIGARQITLAPDTLSALIGMAEREFAAGQSELQAGHPVAARGHFDAAVDVLLSAPSGARAEPRLRMEFERLLDRISALEALALRESDGFTETRSEPAVIDELLTAAMFDRPVPASITGELVASDLAKTPHDLPITINNKVLSYIELFQGNLRDFMEDGLTRGRRYLPMILEVFKSEGLPLDLAFVPLVESAFKNTALSRAQAKGMWQFELGTAKDYGLEHNWFIDERSDPEKATRAAAQHLKMLFQMFDGDWNLALASYNAGQGRVSQAMRRARIDDYWKLTATSRYLPRETREYVPMILAAILIAKDPKQYGFDISEPGPVAYDTVTVPGALDLRVIAEWAEVTVDELRDLNPELRRATTPMGNHELKVPVGTAPMINPKLATADPSLFASFRWHDVRRGETLATIARQYKITTTKLAAANDLKSSARLKPGVRLMVPTVPVQALTSRPAAAQPVVASATPAPSTYRVKRGDTLASIARQFDLTVSDLKRLNQLSTDVIVIGDRLTIRR